MGLKEVLRVLKPGGRLVAFSFSPQQMRGYWLNHYFPLMMKRSSEIIPEKEEMQNILKNCGYSSIEFENYFVQPDLRDHFLYSHKFKHEKYLEEETRKNTSAFSAFSNPAEVKEGLEHLQKDIASGEIKNVLEQYQSTDGDYLFFSARK
jgi:ubiquinone/menaquinone biosynthesis C-methylase UbiE